MASHPHTPASMRVRLAVRDTLSRHIAASSALDRQPLVLVALSGGADSLALAAAVAAESSGLGCRVGAVIIDHGLQEGSTEIADRAADQARGLGLSPVVVRRVRVATGPAASTGGPEAAARSARYRVIAEVAKELECHTVLTAHTRDDQAEQVLLALARGSGTRSIAGIPPERELAEGVSIVRPLLNERAGVTREITETSCAEVGLDPWHDPHNTDPSYLRVRVRTEVLPVLEDALGPGFAAALARSADLAREDADALDLIADQKLAELVRVEFSANNAQLASRVCCPVNALSQMSAALRNRVIRRIAEHYFATQLTREHTLAIASLVTAWRGQGPIHAPGIVAKREAGDLVIFAR
ncbi:tRNA lysidine(34) synthetase TilS [Leucobacter sp. UT-8R-CII-1-4]|uniref:tRNA lysidine(34) synthetase TilS n=1 Tax=Leucobacter sp. UT-8R-CII-1-4 TaxID=3040075 RepID=UPI0024A9469E|nr:tRNA lysidine(34) synthetase TilS [Leucobacter sp. UT-8R-CII-1-4]MDI6022471.1 tRNA lysidine(34) synthetase TilS [Leucobacter sp. UT-8R-CII-1-4]